MAVQKIVTKLQRTRVTVGNYVGTLTHPIYLGMPPLPINVGGMPLKGGNNGLASGIEGISDRRVKVRKLATRKETNNRVNFGSDITTNEGSTRRHEPGFSRVNSKRSNIKTKKTKTKNLLSGIKVIKGKGGRKVYMQNGKFIKKPGGK